MTYEIVKDTLTNNDGNGFSYICADGTAITKGTLLKISDPMTVAIATAYTDPIAGVAAEDKAASNGVTKINVWKSGRFKGYASGAIAVGEPIGCGATATVPNVLQLAIGTATPASGAKIIGYAEETAANGETFFFQMRL